MNEDPPTAFLDYVRETPLLHEELHYVTLAFEWIAAITDVLACAILMIGAARFVWGFARAELSRDTQTRVRGVNTERVELGRYILAGLELLIVSDIIHTALSLAMADLVFLGLLVVIRSLVSYFLDRELSEVKKELRQ
ncbi:DUF1622 domain-containing protein [Jannaschia aquimarina]|uniref:DUF1622 domain-containing protein n=1 Tax=Jannaschia aquimarina TaxID=935700 RepID=A0A0D1DBR6_9RHOB|nr:DUF1622 domain-containing protein [Jannaschia aquimarina]KIT17428.1 hypothetical protein jaqu_08430 [Jannaschia aquimarina]SNT23985.1 Uncharacterized membrane protein [Jannaschia aquimarina]